MRDHWIVRIGIWHFGPFTEDESQAFREEHGGMNYPLWAADERDGWSGLPAIQAAKEDPNVYGKGAVTG